MEKIIFTIKFIFCIFMISTLTGCKKAPISNDIQGFWILQEFKTLNDDVEHKCERLYYSIGRFVTEISERQGNNNYGYYIGLTEFKENNTILVIKNFKYKNIGDNGVDAPLEKLLPFGINNQKETVFKVINCNGKSMILESDYAQLKLKKF